MSYKNLRKTPHTHTPRKCYLFIVINFKLLLSQVVTRKWNKKGTTLNYPTYIYYSRSLYNFPFVIPPFFHEAKWQTIITFFVSWQTERQPDVRTDGHTDTTNVPQPSRMHLRKMVILWNPIWMHCFWDFCLMWKTLGISLCL